MDLPENGFTAFWILFISWMGQHSCEISLHICQQTFCVAVHYFKLLNKSVAFLVEFKSSQ